MYTTKPPPLFIDPRAAAEDGTALPHFARIGSRGNCAAAMSDSSSFDLYSVYNVNADPFATIKAVEKF